MNLQALTRPKITFWRVVLALILISGVYSTIVRFFGGLGASTALSDGAPWGLWIGFDVLTGVALAAGGFTITATVYIFNLKKYHQIIRPTLLTAFMGYLLVSMGLMYDLGRPYRIWHAIIFRNPHSVMFEVAWCVMLYTTVLALEFSPIIFERLNWSRPLKIVKAIVIPLVIAGVLLSTLHQSSLGTVFLIVPQKLHQLWYTPILPLLFFMSAICVGLAMVIFESFLSRRFLGRHLELDILESLSRVLVVAIALYLLVKGLDMGHRHALSLIFKPSTESFLYIAEVLLMAVPCVLLLSNKIRTNEKGLFISAMMVVLGVVLNRLNVSTTALSSSTGVTYFPSLMEISISAFIVALGFIGFALATKYLPIFVEDKEHAPAVEEPQGAGEFILVDDRLYHKDLAFEENIALQNVLKQQI